MAPERSELEQRRAEPRRSLGVGARRAVRRARQSVIVLPSTRRPVDSFDHPGLFMVPLDRPPVAGIIG